MTVTSWYVLGTEERQFAPFFLLVCWNVLSLNTVLHQHVCERSLMMNAASLGHGPGDTYNETVVLLMHGGFPPIDSLPRR
eukprot:3531824-Amphidinium_carterae.1